MTLVLFEIEVAPVYELYRFFVVLGLVGLGVGIIRWWLGAVWLVCPLLVVAVVYGVVQYDHVATFYELIVRNHGRTYVAHSSIAPVRCRGLEPIRDLRRGGEARG